MPSQIVSGVPYSSSYTLDLRIQLKEEHFGNTMF